MADGRFIASEIIPYIVSQVLGGIAGAGVLCLIASGQVGFHINGGLSSNGYSDHSPGAYLLTSGFVTEVVKTFMFLLIIPGRTDDRAPKGFAPIAIGLGLTLILASSNCWCDTGRICL